MHLLSLMLDILILMVLRYQILIYIVLLLVAWFYLTITHSNIAHVVHIVSLYFTSSTTIHWVAEVI